MNFFKYLFPLKKCSDFTKVSFGSIMQQVYLASPEAILLTNSAGEIIDCNERLCQWVGCNKKTLIYKKISNLSFVDKKSRSIISCAIKKEINTEQEVPCEIQLFGKNKKKINIRMYNSIIRDQDHQFVGNILILKDITEANNVISEQKLLYNDMKIISDSSIGFTELESDDDIYLFIGRRLKKLIGECYVMVNRYLPDKSATQAVHFLGPSLKQKKALQAIKAWPIGQYYPLSEEAKKGLLSRSLKKMKAGVNEISQGKVPPITGHIIELVFGLGDIYTLGFAWKGTIFGNATILMKRGYQLREESISTFLHQASVALQRKQSADALKKAHDELEIKVEERTRELRLSNQDLEKFKLAVKDASDHIIITDLKGHIIFANAAAERITGYSFEQMQGKTPALWGKQMGDDFYKKFWNTINSKKPFLGEIRNKRSGNVEYWAEIHVSPVLDSDYNIQFFVGIERDITKAKEVDQAKTEFVSLASHQLRTPLSAINWYTEMLLAGDAGNITSDQESYLKEIYSGSQRMVDLVNALLNVSRLELGTFIVEPTEGSLQEICDDVLKELENQTIAKKQQVSKEYDKDLPKIMIDIKLTRIVFQNLLSNAVKYTPEEGKVTASILINPDNNKEILIKIADTGYGIPKYQQDKIFSKLFRADNVKKMETEGTGLGVYIIKQIIDNAGGKIWFKSEENKGSTFFVTIPLSGMRKKTGSRELS